MLGAKRHTRFLTSRVHESHVFIDHVIMSYPLFPSFPSIMFLLSFVSSEKKKKCLGPPANSGVRGGDGRRSLPVFSEVPQPLGAHVPAGEAEPREDNHTGKFFSSYLCSCFVAFLI